MARDSQVLNHFKTNDPIIYNVLQDTNLKKWSKNKHTPDLYFNSLVNQIVSQQLSTKVADVISLRLASLIGSQPFTPKTLLVMGDEELRTVGLSYAKISYIKNLATKILEGEINLVKLQKMTDDAVIAELTQVKGIGKWTAEMFLMFSLGREDIFSFGDWGLKNAIKNIYELEDYPNLSELHSISEKWKPYRSYASYALWQSLEKKR